MNCKVYRASRQDEMYVYVKEGLEPGDLPEELLKLVKQLQHVMDLELSPERELAREDVMEVLTNLKSKGYHLQMPPDPLKTELHQGD